MSEKPDLRATSTTRPSLLDLDDPDAEFFLAAEKEGDLPAYRRALVVIVTDRDPESWEDTGRLVTELLAEDDFTVDGIVMVRNDQSQIRQAIETAVIGGVDLVVSIGGTGVGARDCTPEATSSVVDMRVPGGAQALRSSGQACGAVDACTSRGICGISGSTVVVNLASSRAAIRDGMATLGTLVHHLIDQLQKHSLDS